MNVTLKIEHPSLALLQCVHDFEALDRRIRRLPFLEPANRADQLFQLAMIRLDHIVQVFHLAVLGFGRQLAFLLQLVNRRAIGVFPSPARSAKPSDRLSNDQQACHARSSSLQDRAVADPVPAVPADSPQHDFARMMPTFENVQLFSPRSMSELILPDQRDVCNRAGRKMASERQSIAVGSVCRAG